MKKINKFEELDNRIINTTNSWTTAENREGQANFIVAILILAAVIGVFLSILE